MYVHFPYVYRQAAVQTTGCLGGRFEPMSRLVESRADTGTQPCPGIRSSLRSPDRWQCPLGFHSDRLEDTDTNDCDNSIAARVWSTFIPDTASFPHRSGDGCDTNKQARTYSSWNNHPIYNIYLLTHPPPFVIIMYQEMIFLKLLSGILSEPKRKKNNINIRSGVQILRDWVFPWLGS